MGSEPPPSSGELLQAARDAVARGDLDGASRAYKAFIASTSGLDRAVAMTELAGDVLRNQGFLRSAQETLERAEALSAAAGDDRVRLKALVGLGTLHTQRGSVEATKVCLDKALRIMGELTDRRTDALVLGNLASLYFNTGRLEDAVQAYERSLRADQLTRDRRGEAINLGNIAMVEFARGRTPEARARYEKALGIARDIGQEEHEAHLLVQIGTLDLAGGDGAAASRAFDLAREKGRNPSIVALAKAGLATFHDRRGATRTALELMDETLLVLRATGDRLVLPFLMSDRATILAHRGRLAAARRELDEAHEIAASIGNRRLDASIMLSRAQIQHVQGYISAAWQDVSTGERLATETVDPRVRAEALATAGLVMGELGLQDDGASLLEEAVAAARAVGEAHLDLLVLGIVATARSLQGGGRAAREVAHEALSRSRDLGNLRHECVARCALARLDLAEGELSGAREAASQALRIARMLEDDAVAGEAMTLLARALVKDDPDGAWEAADGAVELLTVFDAPLARATALIEREDALRRLGNSMADDVREAAAIASSLSGRRAEQLRARIDDMSLA